MISVQFLVSKSRDNQKEKVLAEFLFLRISFLLRLLVTLPKEHDEGALAWPVAFRWSKSLFRDGNSQWQVVQLIRTSLTVCVCGSVYVKHYWYTSWPDHKTPDSAQPLLQLMLDVEEDRLASTGRGPVVVHCR